MVIMSCFVLFYHGPLKTQPVIIMQTLENLMTLHGVTLIVNGYWKRGRYRMCQHTSGGRKQNPLMTL